MKTGKNDALLQSHGCCQLFYLSAKLTVSQQQQFMCDSSPGVGTQEAVMALRFCQTGWTNNIFFTAIRIVCSSSIPHLIKIDRVVNYIDGAWLCSYFLF